MKPEVNYFFFLDNSKLLLVVTRGSKDGKFYLSNEKSSIRLVCNDSNMVDIYLINVQLCVKSRVG